MLKLAIFSFTKLLLLQHGLFIDFIFDFSHFSLYDQSRFMHVFVYILVGKCGGGEEAVHMTSLKQRTATLRFRHDNGAQNSTDCFIEHRLETFLRQC